MLRTRNCALATRHQVLHRGVVTGVDIGIYTPKISPSKLLWGKNDIRMAIQQFYTPQNKFLATTLDYYTPLPSKCWLQNILFHNDLEF